MNKTYHYTIEGTAVAGQTWTTTGIVVCQFHESFMLACTQSFEQLTQGRAVYGQPGVGCHGPYDILKVTIEQVKEQTNG